MESKTSTASGSSRSSSTVDSCVGPYPEHTKETQKFIEREVFITIGPIIINGEFGKIRPAKYEGKKLIMKAIEGTKHVVQLKFEFDIIRQLQCVKGVPRIFGYGCINFREHFFLMERLGTSMSQLLELCGGTFSDNTMANIALRVFDILKEIHARNIVHGDLKPSNIMIGHGIPQREQFYLIGFELSSKYDPPTPVSHQEHTGTPKYKSINAHKEYTLRPDDDIESFGYVLLQMSKGSLPWDSELEKDVSKKEIEQNILKIKESMDISALSEGVSDVFVNYFAQVFIYRDQRELARKSEIMHSRGKTKIEYFEPPHKAVARLGQICASAGSSVETIEDIHGNPIINYENMDCSFRLLHYKTRVLSADERVRWDWENKLVQREFTELDTVKESGPYTFQEYHDVDERREEL